MRPPILSRLLVILMAIQVLELLWETLDLFVGKILYVNHADPGILYCQNQLVELTVNRLGVSVLSGLDEHHHHHARCNIRPILRGASVFHPDESKNAKYSPVRIPDIKGFSPAVPLPMSSVPTIPAPRFARMPVQWKWRAKRGRSFDTGTPAVRGR